MPKIYGNTFVVFLYHLIFFQILLLGCGNPKNSLLSFSKETDSIMLKANRLQSDGHLKEAIQYINSSYNKYKSGNKIDLWRKYEFCANHFLNYEPQLHKASLYVDSMQLLVNGREKQLPELYVSTVFKHADILIAQKRYNEAFQNYYDGRLFAKEYLDSCTYKKFTYYLGIVRYKQGQYSQAIPYMQQALSNRETCKESFSESVAQPQSYINTLALCYEKLGQLDSAVYHYKKALTLLIENKQKYKTDSTFLNSAIGVVLGNLGGVYVKMHNKDLAMQYLKESILINDRPGYEVVDAITAQLKLIDMLIGEKMYKEANEYLQRAKQKIDWHGAQNRDVDRLLIKWFKLKWQYSEDIGNKEEAYRYSKEYIQLKDSIQTLRQGLLPVDMENAFKIKEQQHSITLLDRDNQLKKLWLTAAFILVIMIIIIAYIIWSNLMTTKENVANLTKLNKQVKEQNTQMQKVLFDLEQSHADNTKLMKIVAHDLRNPLEGIKSIAGLIEVNRKEDIEILDMIKEASKNALELVSDLLHMKSSMEELSKDEIDLDKLLKYCVDLLKHKAAEKGQCILLETLKINILGYREKLWRVMSNLITNAIKFSDEGALIKVNVERMGHQVQIVVRDTGIGIPREIKPYIFDVFSKSKRLGTRGEMSYGLGLAISRQIVELHGGQIWVESEIGKGSSFYVLIPIN